MQSVDTSINLSDYAGCRRSDEFRDFGFELVPSKGARVYNLATTSEEDLKAWTEAIDASIPERRIKELKMASFQDCIGFLLLRCETTRDLFRCAAMCLYVYAR